MKKLFFLMLFHFSIFSIYAQAPQKVSYQAVIRNASNNLLSSKLVSVRLSIIQNSIEDGKTVYVETHLAVTNMNGLISIQLGAGVVWLGKFTNIDWGKGPYFVKTETDPDGGYDFKIIGSSELLTVPYALYALKSGDSFDSTSMNKRIVDLQNQSNLNTINIKNNIDSIKVNAQQIQINLNNIHSNTTNIKSNLDSLAGKINSVDLDALLLEYQKVGKFVSAISLEGLDSFDIKINGNLTASKNVTVGGNIESLGATSTLGTLEKPFKGLFISSGSLSIASDTLGLQIPAAILSNVEGNLQISAGGLKLMGENSSFIAPSIVSTLTGNASTATKLNTARKINGVAFDGSADIEIATTASNSLTYNNTGTGDVPGGTFNGSITKTISYNSIGASPLAGSNFITSVGILSAGSIPYSLLSGTVPTWDQSTLGNAATVTTNANLTGVVTSLGNVTSIASGTISNSMLANTAVANLSGTNTGDETTATLKTKLGVTTLSGTNTGDQINITGNAGTATKLAATKLINGVAFDGSADITITAVADAGTLSGTSLASTIKNSSLTSVGILSAGSIPYSLLSGTVPTWDQSTLGNAATVTTNANLTGVVTSLGNVTSIASGTISNSMLANTAVANLSGTNTGDQINVTGNAATVTTNANLTGVVTSLGNVTSIATGTITNSMLANTAVANLSGTNTGDQINISGNAATVTTNANLTGVVTSLGNVTSIASGTITNSMLANTAVANLSGTNTGDQINISGNSATVTTNANLTGVVTSLGNVTSIASGTISNSMLANTAVANLSGTNTGDQTIILTGDITGTGSGTITSTLANTTVTAASYGSSTAIPTFTVDEKGRLTTAGNTTIIANAGTLSGTITTSGKVANSATTATSNNTASAIVARDVSGNFTANIITGTLSGTSNNVSGIVAIVNGGTNTTATPTAGAISYGTGTAQAYTSAGTTGQYLQSAGVGSPVWAQPGPVSVTVLTSLVASSTFTVTSGVKAILVELIGGGGGSGAVAGNNTVNSATASGGGASGSYTRLLILSPAGTYTYTIGVGGTASAILTAGGNGGITYFGSIASAPGGLGGSAGFAAATTGTSSLGGAGGGIGTGGNFMINGNAGGTGLSSRYGANGGTGASSYFGGGTVSPAVIAGNTASGISPSINSYGVGASGAANVVLNNSTGAGAAGYQGVIIITMYK